MIPILVALIIGVPLVVGVWAYFRHGRKPPLQECRDSVIKETEAALEIGKAAASLAAASDVTFEQAAQSLMAIPSHPVVMSRTPATPLPSTALPITPSVTASLIWGPAAKEAAAFREQLDAARAVPEREDIVVEVWRTYCLQRSLTFTQGQRWMLEGAKAEWRTRQFQAECSGSTLAAEIHLSQGDCPDNFLGQGCGIYGMNDRDNVGYYSDGVATVHALCVMWGWLIPGTTGWMGQFCRIEQLYLMNPGGELFEPNRIADELAAQYDVPVVVELIAKESSFPDDPYFAPGAFQASLKSPFAPGPSIYNPPGGIYTPWSGRS